MVKFGVVIGFIFLFGLAVMYNKKIIGRLENTSDGAKGVFNRLFGEKLRVWQQNLERRSGLDNGSMLHKVNAYFGEIIVNLDMEKDNVTPVGLLTFIFSTSIGASVLFFLWSGELSLLLPMFLAVFYFIMVLFRFFSLLQYEKREALIMDAEDLISMDVSSGVLNAINRYSNSFHPYIRPYFTEFLDNINNKGYSFEVAMRMLNERLGSTFSTFSRNAIMYEAKADDEMVDIFSSVVDINRKRRELRYNNNKKFEVLRLQFLVSIGLIAAYGLFSVFTDSFMAHFFSNTFAGKLTIIIDLVLITGVMGYISSIKAKFI